MLIRELFEDDSTSLVDDLRSILIDVLTPLAASKVPFVTMQQIIDRLQAVRSGLRVDRALVSSILDPNKVKIVDRIEGDQIRLTVPEADLVQKTDEDEEKDMQELQVRANKQAEKEVKTKSKIANKALKAEKSAKSKATDNIAAAARDKLFR